MLGLFKALQSGLSQKTTETLMPTNGSTTTVNPLLNRIQSSIESAAEVGNALERGEREGWIEASKREKRGATGAVKQQKEKLSELNSLLRGNKIQIRLTSISNNYASFNVQGSNRDAIRSFSIGYYDGDMLSGMTVNSTIIVATNREKLGKFEPEDVNYGLWSNAFNDIGNIEFTTYKGKRFLDSVLPSLGRALLETSNPLITGTSTVGTTTLLTQETSSTETVPTTGITSTEGTSTVGTTTLSTETVSHDDPNYIFNIAIEPSTEPIENNTSTELFDFASSKAEEKSTTEGIDHTMQEIRESSKYVYPIAPTPLMRQIISNGAFSIGNETATWINRETNRTGEVSVFNETSIGKAPTAVPAIEGLAVGMSTVAIASLATLGGLGLFLAGVGIKKLYDYRYKASRYDVTKPNPEEQRQPLNPEDTSGGATVITMELVPESEAEQQLLSQDGEPVGENAPTRLPRAEPKPLETIPEEEEPCGAGSISSAKGLYDHAFDALRRSIHQVISVLNHAQPQTENLESPKSSISGSRTSVHSNSTGVSEGNSFYI